MPRVLIAPDSFKGSLGAPEVAAALARQGPLVFAWRGATPAEYQHFVELVGRVGPDLVLDDGADLSVWLHRHPDLVGRVGGITEETTTGLMRLRALARSGRLAYPMIAVNDADMKHLFDNRYGTGQSTWDAIMRHTNLVVPGAVAVVSGYGWCGKGVAQRARGLGARVGVTDPGAPVPAVPPGGSLRAVLAGMVRDVGRAAGISYERFDDDQLMTMQQYNLFPNVSLVFFPDLLTVLRSRPGTHPAEGFLDVLNYRRCPPGAPRTHPVDVAIPAGQDPNLSLVLDQDAANVERAQRGLHQPGFTRMTLSREEFRILNLHRNLEQWLGIDPSEISGDEPAS